MAHRIHEEKVYSFRKPMWHELGIIGQEEESIREVMERLQIPHVGLYPVNAQAVDLSGYRAIMCGRECFGVVTDTYQIIDHQMFLEAWARVIPSHCETMGVIDKGKTVFVSVKLPPFEIMNDEFRPYLWGNNTIDGKTGIVTKPTSVRVICANTNAAALRQYSNVTFTGRHTGKDLLERFTKYLQQTWDARSGNLEIMKEAYLAMARMKVSLDGVKAYCQEVYPLPEHPQSKEKVVLEKWEEACLDQTKHHKGVVQLFEDSPTRTQATTGNLFGAYQAVVEYEERYRRKNTARSVTFGLGSKRIDNAFHVAVGKLK